MSKLQVLNAILYVDEQGCKIHLVAADDQTAIAFALSPGQAHDAPEGRKLLKELGPPAWPMHLIMDKAYEGNQTRQLAAGDGPYGIASREVQGVDFRRNKLSMNSVTGRWRTRRRAGR